MNDDANGRAAQTGAFRPLDYPLALEFPVRVVSSHWHEHVPFALAVVEMTRPQVLVELGVFAGVSYCAFCQAIDSLRLPCRAYGVDTWRGDPHNGPNGDEVLADLRAQHDPLFGSFSRLVPADFDHAVSQFPDASIDLLHIDGYHTYEAVKNDYTRWLPKMSRQGLILFHDIHVREGSFGVWRLWEELITQYPTFEFVHQHGLGVLPVGADQPDAIRQLVATHGSERAMVQKFYHELGRRISTQAELARRQREHDAESHSRRGALEAESGARKEILQSYLESQGRLRAREEQMAVLEENERVLQSLLAAREKTISEMAVRAAEAAEAAATRTRHLLQVNHHQAMHIDQLVAVNLSLATQLNQAIAEASAVRSSLAVRLTRPLATACRWVAPAGSFQRRALRNVRRSLAVLRREGVRAFFRKSKRKAGALLAK